MMKKILIILQIIMILIFTKLIVTFAINEKFIEDYEDGNYDENKVKKLLILNISEPCIAHYNHGNILYKEGNFNDAITEYEKALNLFPTKDQECSIRINLALAMLQKIDEKDKSEDNKKITLNILEDAKAVLCENGCANENDDNGHSEEAEKLKKEIEEKIKELQENNSGDDSDDGDDKDDPNDDKKNSNKNKQDEVQDKLEQLKKIQEQARGDRQEDLDYWRQSMDVYGYNYGRNW